MGSLILHPSEADRKKTFHALHVQPYLRLGVVRGHIDPVIIAAMCFTGARQQGCEEIVVGLEGMLPRKYTLQAVWERICSDPTVRRFYRPPAVDPIQVQRERIHEKYFQQSSTHKRS